MPVGFPRRNESDIAKVRERVVDFAEVEARGFCNVRHWHDHAPVEQRFVGEKRPHNFNVIIGT
jgi:hypothetical protein